MQSQCKVYPPEAGVARAQELRSRRRAATHAPDFQNLLNQIGDTVAALQSASLFGDASAELEQAFSDSESCQELQTES